MAALVVSAVDWVARHNASRLRLDDVEVVVHHLLSSSHLNTLHGSVRGLALHAPRSRSRTCRPGRQLRAVVRRGRPTHSGQCAVILH